MVNYQNAKIYKLVNNSSDDCYYGSTCNELHKRKSQHKNNYKEWKKGNYHFVTSFPLFEDDEDDVEIILVEELSCENSEQLHARERFWVENNPCINKCIPNRTLKEYYQDNKNRLLDNSKKYYQNNKNYIKEYSKEYRQNNKNKIQQYQKEYRQYNKNKSQQYKQEYFLKNKEKISNQMKEKLKCVCGSLVSNRNNARHSRTFKHKKYEEDLKRENI
jgi:hypothetical protein